MSSTLLHILDYLLYCIHIIVMAVNLFGWIFKKTRRLQLVVVLTTALSWFVAGIWYGWGYCFLTDWEWEIKGKIGEFNLPISFVHYLSNNSLGLNIDLELLDIFTVAGFILALTAGLIVNFRDFIAHKKCAGS